MTNNLYIASIEPGCGKSVIALGITDLLSRHFNGVSFFRPIISDRAGRDDHIELVRAKYCAERPYESLYGVSHETAWRADLSDSRRHIYHGHEGAHRPSHHDPRRRHQSRCRIGDILDSDRHGCVETRAAAVVHAS